jgi:hypothetical protein
MTSAGTVELGGREGRAAFGESISIVLPPVKIEFEVATIKPSPPREIGRVNTQMN